jgi:hypothetical protein
MSVHKELRVTKAQPKYQLPRLHWSSDVQFLLLLMARYQNYQFFLHCHDFNATRSIQAQQALFGTQHLLGPTKLVTRCLGTQIALVLI